ncbi:MAG: replicative DNA helicase [Bacteroidia bacterium]
MAKKTSRPPTLAGKIIPQALEVEKALLGALLIEKDAIVKVLDLLQPETFYDPRHQRIYATLRKLYDHGQPIDLLTATEELRKEGLLREIEPYYLVELTTHVSSGAHVESYARILVEKYLLRQSITLGTQLVERAFGEEEDAFMLLDWAEQELYQLSQHHLRRSVQPASRLLSDTLQALEKLRHHESTLTGIPSSFPALDQLTAGWQKSDLIIIAARPSMGKTAFVLNLARHAAFQNFPVAFFSLEMSASQLMLRFISLETEISSEKLRNGRLSEETWLMLPKKLEKLSQAPIFIDDTPAIPVYDVRAKCRRLKSEYDIQLVIIDYLQLMGSGSRTLNREQEIASISRSLKELARELEVPVIALSQLSRAVEQRGGDKRPQLSDLRESGSIEQDADVVIFLYRPEYYGFRQDEEGNPTEGIAEVIIGKQRNGPIGKVRLQFISDYMKFLPVQESAAPPPQTFTRPSRANQEPPNTWEMPPF